jgi:hypothetical protein
VSSVSRQTKSIWFVWIPRLVLTSEFANKYTGFKLLHHGTLHFFVRIYPEILQGKTEGVRWGTQKYWNLFVNKENISLDTNVFRDSTDECELFLNESQEKEHSWLDLKTAFFLETKQMEFNILNMIFTPPTIYRYITTFTNAHVPAGQRPPPSHSRLTDFLNELLKRLIQEQTKP